MSIRHKQFAIPIATIFFFFILIVQNSAQKYASLVGAKIGIETYEFSTKIALDDKNYLEGTFGIVTPQPDYTLGVGVAYHRHIHLNEAKTLQFYYGFGGKAVFVDESGFGIGPQTGLIALYKKLNIGIDLLPTYFFNDALEFRPLFGIHLRYVNY
jgi:hypothetical protein